MSTREPREVIEGAAAGVDPDVARAEAQIAADRDRVARSMLALRREVRRRTDWRGWVARKPLGALTTAFAIGLFLGLRAATRARGRR